MYLAHRSPAASAASAASGSSATTTTASMLVLSNVNQDKIAYIEALARLGAYKENCTFHIYIHAKHSRACQCLGPDIIQTAIDLFVLWPFSMVWEMNHGFFFGCCSSWHHLFNPYTPRFP